MTLYTVYGPHKIPTKRLHKGRRIEEPDEFWQQSSELESLRNRQGVYVFGMRAGLGITPYYVGKTVREFEDECFAYHKLDKYHEAINNQAGKPVMFFIARPIGRGKIQSKQISQMMTVQ